MQKQRKRLHDVEMPSPLTETCNVCVVTECASSIKHKIQLSAPVNVMKACKWNRGVSPRTANLGTDKVSGQLHAPTVLLPASSPVVPI
jgi:hypothetical protein